jgi:phenylacetate-CoA ligase
MKSIIMISSQRSQCGLDAGSWTRRLNRAMRDIEGEAGVSFFDPARETLDREAIRRLQEEKLRRLMAAVEDNPFCTAKLASAGKRPSDVKTLRDLDELPFTTKSELVEAQRAHPPFGNLLTYPLTRYRRLHGTSGTSGKPLLWLDSDEDWETWIRCWGYVYRGAGVREEDVMFMAFSFGPYVSHWAALAGAERLGALCLTGGGMSSLQRLQAIVTHRSTVVVCTPTYALHLAELAEANGIDLPSSDVRITIHAGEPGASVPNVKRRIEEAWGARCFDHAGATEVGAWAFDCQEPNGSIHLNELEFIFDVVDPDSGTRVPNGERGELVITTLERPGMPVLRYRTGDLVERLLEPCGCGRTLASIRGGVLGRADDMLIVRGVNMYPSAIDNVVRAVPQILEYEVEIRESAGSHDILIKLETTDGARFDDVKGSLLGGFRSQFNSRVDVQEVARQSLPRYELKSRRYKHVTEGR